MEFNRQMIKTLFLGRREMTKETITEVTMAVTGHFICLFGPLGDLPELGFITIPNLQERNLRRIEVKSLALLVSYW